MFIYLFVVSCNFVYLPPPHTKQVLTDVLLDVLLDWNMDRKLTITMNNFSSNDDMIDILSEKLSSIGSLVLQEKKIFHMHCVPHILNLNVKEGLNVIRV